MNFSSEEKRFSLDKKSSSNNSYFNSIERLRSRSSRYNGRKIGQTSRRIRKQRFRRNVKRNATIRCKKTNSSFFISKNLSFSFNMRVMVDYQRTTHELIRLRQPKETFTAVCLSMFGFFRFETVCFFLVFRRRQRG